MEKINQMVCWYQQMIGTYDKQLWERSVEKTVIKNIEHVPRKLTKVKTDLIDVDLVRGSTFPKAKPKHGWWLVSWRGLLRVVFLPLYMKWWRQQSSIWFSLLLLFLYISQVGTLVLYYSDSGSNVSSETLSLAHLITPVILIIILGFIHSQIVATQSLHKHRRPHSPDRCTGAVKKKHKGSKSSTRSPKPGVVDDYTIGHADTEETENLRRRKKKVVRKKLSEEYSGLKSERIPHRLCEIDKSTSVDSSNVCTEEEDLGKIFRRDTEGLSSARKHRGICDSAENLSKSADTTKCDKTENAGPVNSSNDDTTKGYTAESINTDNVINVGPNLGPTLNSYVNDILHNTVDQSFVDQTEDETIPSTNKQDPCSHVTGSDVTPADDYSNDGICHLKDKNLTYSQENIEKNNIQSNATVDRHSENNSSNTLCYKDRVFHNDDVLDCPSNEDINLPLASFEGEILAPDENGFQLSHGVHVSCDEPVSISSHQSPEKSAGCNAKGPKLVSRMSSSEKSIVNGTSEEGTSDFENILLGLDSNESRSNLPEGNVDNLEIPSFSCLEENGKNSFEVFDVDIPKGTEDGDVKKLKKATAIDADDKDEVESYSLNSSSGTFVPGEVLAYCDTPKRAQYYGQDENVRGLESTREVEDIGRGVGTLESVENNMGLKKKVSDRRLALDIKQAHRPSDPVINTKSTTLPKITRDDLCVNDSSVKWEELRDSSAIGRSRFASVPASSRRGCEESSGNSSCESDGETTPNVPTPKKELRKRSVTVNTVCGSTDGQTSEMEWDANSGDMTTDTSSQVTTETELSGQEEEARDSDGYGWSENLHHANSVMNNLASSNDKVSVDPLFPFWLVSCIIWETEEVKKVDLTVLDLGWTIIQKADKIPEKSDYVFLGLIFSLVIMCLPALYRFHQLRDRLEALHCMGNITGCLHVMRILIGDNWLEQVVILNGLLQRFCIALIFFFLLSVAERTFKQRLLYAKHFCYLTSCRRAKKYDMPHFRLNKVRNIKTWLSLRSYLKRRGPQRSVNTIVSSAFILEVTFLSLMCVELLHDSGGFLDHLGNWELVMWCLTLGVYLLRFMTLGTQINKKYRNFSVLITEQINLYLHMEQKPHKKEELILANNVLKLAEALLKELENPFKISGLSVNPFLYNTFKVVILSAFSAVLTELLGFKLKLYKIKLKA